LFVLLIGGLVIGSKREITSGIILKIALVFAVAIPFLLPEMHERYFYLADVLSILYAFYYPRRFYVPILVQFCSLFSYAPYFLGRQIIPLPYLTAIELVVVIITAIDLIMDLYPEQFKRIPPMTATRDVDEMVVEGIIMNVVE
jgi:Gpi18-like mannosyltransferase